MYVPPDEADRAYVRRALHNPHSLRIPFIIFCVLSSATLLVLAFTNENGPVAYLRESFTASGFIVNIFFIAAWALWVFGNHYALVMARAAWKTTKVVPLIVGGLYAWGFGRLLIAALLGLAHTNLGYFIVSSSDIILATISGVAGPVAMEVGMFIHGIVHGFSDGDAELARSIDELDGPQRGTDDADPGGPPKGAAPA